jgi:predicted amidohydrolase
MRVTLAQFDIHWEDPNANLAMVKTMIPQGTDLVVLPEMFLTGFTMNPHGVAASMDGDDIQSLQDIANTSGTALMGSLVVKEGNHLYNRMILFTPDGEMQYYDKRHLFSFGGEGRNYTAGENEGIFHLNGWKLCARICYDLRFPVWCRNTMDYDLIVFVASWPKARHHAWINLIQARAIENQAYAIGVNRLGRDGNNLEYLGGSMTVDYNGEVIGDAGDGNDLVTVDLDRNAMLHYRSKLPFLKDQDRFAIDG